MLGATAVGKTSLVRRFVESLFSEKYQATIGVKIDRKLMQSPEGQVSLLLWDLQGEDDFRKLRTSYLRGACGLILVADGTREDTVRTARAVHESALETVGEVPAVLLLNKSDLDHFWRVDEEYIDLNGPKDVSVLRTSAKTGENVEAGFSKLLELMLV